MWKFGKPKIWSVGLGASLVGATALAVRYAWRATRIRGLPENVAPETFSSRVFYSSQGEMFYRTGGEGPPVVFVHGVGVGAASFEWRPVYEQFAARHRVLAVDLLGFGESRRPAQPLAAEDYARTLAEFVRGTCAPRRPVVVGSGLGAGFCLAMARHHPELAERVIALLPSGMDGMGGRQLPFGMRLAGRVPGLNRFLYQNYLASRTAIRRWLEEAGFYNPAGVREELVDIYHRYAQQAGAEHAIFSFLQGRLSVPLERILPEVTSPVHVLWICNERLPGEETGERLTALAPRSTFDTIPEAGLLAAVEQPEVVGELIADLLDGPTLRVV